MPTTSWDEIEKNKDSKGDKFIRLKDGEHVEGVFAGQPFKFFNDFKAKQTYDKWREGLSTRYRVNFVVNDGLGWVARIYETGSTTIKLISEQVKEYGKDCIFKLKRTGKGKDRSD
jgi:hypothetical protein